MLKKMEKQMRGMKSRYYNVVPPKVLYDVNDFDQMFKYVGARKFIGCRLRFKH